MTEAAPAAAAAAPANANPILAAVGGNDVAFKVSYPTCCDACCKCKRNTWDFFNPTTPGNVVFHGEVKQPCCGDWTIAVQDAKGQPAFTPYWKQCACNTPCSPFAFVQGPAGTTVGALYPPTCKQQCQNSYCPCMDSILMRVCDEKDTQTHYTLRIPGCSLSDCQCDTRCPRCKMAACTCTSDFDMTVLVYSGKEEEKDPVSKVHWQGKMECCTKRVLPGYTTTVSIPASATHEQTMCLIMLAINLDEGMVGPRRQPPQN